MTMRINNMSLPPSLRYIFIHWGTNNIGHNNPEVASDGLINLAWVRKKKYKDVKIIICSLLPRDKANSQKRSLVIVTNIYLKEACNVNSFSFVELDSGWIVGSSLNMLLFKNDHLHLTKFGYEKLSLLFVSQLNSVLGKTHETPQYAYSYKSAISFTLNKEEFPPLLSVYSSMGSFTDAANSSVRVRQSSDKSIFPLSQPNIHNSVSSWKSNTKIEIPVKFNKIRPTHRSSKVSSKVYLGNANRVLREDVLKPRSIATCNLTHKAAKIPHVMLDIRKPTNNQSPTLSPNVVGSLRLNTSNHHLPTYVNHLIVLPNCLIWRPATQHMKNCIMIVVLILKMYWQIICVTNRIIYGGNITSKKKIFCLHTCVNFCFYSFFWAITLILFLIIINNFILWKCTLPCRVNIFFVGNSINKFVEVTTRGKQLLKLSKPY